MHATHEVLNQPEPLVDCNLFETNRALQDALRIAAPQLDRAPLSRLGALAGSAQMQVHARLANTHGPELRTHDRFGRRIDEVDLHATLLRHSHDRLDRRRTEHNRVGGFRRDIH